jgi:selenocysteine lyase/cysteine desulfurase
LSSGGDAETFTSPFEVPSSSAKKGGNKFLTVPLVYCDQTASNRPIRSVEKYMEKTCLPLYGNTHTNTSITGSQSTAFVAEARQIVAESTNAKITGKASLDVVLFSGNGTTSAVELLIDCLGLKHAALDKTSRPVVFIGPYEHHSNLLPWRESGCEIVMVSECPKTGSVDLIALEKFLLQPQYAKRLKMGTFSAASNVNGRISDVDAISATLHRHGALAFFDYATAAPYMPMNMNPAPCTKYPSASFVAKDAMFFSPHKMLGGVGTPGVLIIKKNLVSQIDAPSRSGGGTVFYVTNTHHRFLSNRIERYEGGTPNITGIMRTGLTLLMKRKAEEHYSLLRNGNDVVGSFPETLLGYECETYTRVVNVLGQRAPNIVMLGGPSGGQHLPIFSFLVRCGRRFLHYNYVCALLNDVFGIQSRGGCQCSGPYSQRLLGLAETASDGSEVPNERNDQVENALVNYKERAEVLRPGYTRLSLPFKGITDEEVEYVLKALEWIAMNGWALMCQYRCNHRTGEVSAMLINSVLA